MKQLSPTLVAAPNARPWHIVPLVMILLFGLALRLNNLDSKSLWVDEIGQVLVSRQEFMAAVRGASTHFGAAPLDYVITHIVMQTLGQGDAALRLPSVIWGAVSILLIYWLGSSLFGSRWVGLVSAFLLALTPAHIELSQEVRWYSLSTMISLLSANLVVMAVQRRGNLYWLGLMVALLLSVATALHHVLTTMAIFIAMLLLWLLARRSAPEASETPVVRRCDIIRFAAASVPAAIFVLYWYLSGSVRSEVGGEFEFTPIPWDILLTYPVFGWYHDPLRPWPFPVSFLGPVLFPLLSTAGLIASAVGRKRLAIIPLCIVLICGAGILLIDAQFSYFWAYRQFLFLVPFYLLFVAYGLVAVAGLVGKPRWLRYPVLATFLGVILWFTLPEIKAYYNFPKTNWRAAAHLLFHAAGNPSSVIVYPDNMQSYLLFYQPTLKSRLVSPTALDVENGANQRIWYSGPSDKLDQLRQAGWQSVSVNPGIQFYYLGQAEVEVLYQELTQILLPPEVLINGFLYGLRNINQQQALDMGKSAIAELGHTYFPLSSKTKADLATVVGRMHFDAGQTDEAVSLLNWAVDNDETNIDALPTLGYIYLSMGNIESAREVLEASVRYHPRTYWSYVFLTGIYAKLKSG